MELKKEIKENVIKKVETLERIDDELLKKILKKEIMEATNDNFISNKLKSRLLDEIFYDFRKHGFIQKLLLDDHISEIMINGKDKIFYEKNGRMTQSDLRFESEEKLYSFIQNIVSKINRKVNRTNPIVDARLDSGERVNIILPPVALNGPIVTIRKFKKELNNFDSLIDKKTINIAIKDFLIKMVRAKYNMFICGGTSSGKTTLLNVLCHYIPKTERIITIEDSAEMSIKGIENLIKLETRNKSIDGKNEVKISDLIKNSLRMRPDRIIVGEVRGVEAYDMLNAMNTGHDGAISTGHGNSIKDMISRLEMMVLMGKDYPIQSIKKQICSALDLMIFIKKYSNNVRKVKKISEIIKLEDNRIIFNDIFVFNEKNNDWNQLNTLENTSKMEVFNNFY